MEDFKELSSSEDPPEHLAERGKELAMPPCKTSTSDVEAFAFSSKSGYSSTVQRLVLSSIAIAATEFQAAGRLHKPEAKT